MADGRLDFLALGGPISSRFHPPTHPRKISKVELYRHLDCLLNSILAPQFDFFFPSFFKLNFMELKINKIKKKSMGAGSSLKLYCYARVPADCGSDL
jgi:hypothetical protein